MATPSEAERSTSPRTRATDNKQLNRSAAEPQQSPADKKADKKGKDTSRSAPRVDADEAKREKERQQETARRQRYEQVGIVGGRSYEFKDSKGQSSWVKVDTSKAVFVDKAGRSFLTLSHATLWEVLATTGDTLQRATEKYESSAKYQHAQVKQYYDVFRPGNALASNGLGSGQFRYEISEQHLATSVTTQLEHVARMMGSDSLTAFFGQFADKNPGLECWGTTMHNVLKARGLVPPTHTREEFEKQYAPILSSLPEDQRRAMFGSLSALKRLGQYGSKVALENLVARLSKVEWARFTGMSERGNKVRMLLTAKEVAAAVGNGHAVFVGVPGHYKSAIGGDSNKLEYHDPLGFWGYRLYGDKPVRFGLVIE